MFSNLTSHSDSVTKIYEAWKHNRNLTLPNNNLWTANGNVYSFGMQIGFTLATGEKVIGIPNSSITPVTDRHISAIGFWADYRVMMVRDSNPRTNYNQRLPYKGEFYLSYAEKSYKTIKGAQKHCGENQFIVMSKWGNNYRPATMHYADIGIDDNYELARVMEHYSRKDEDTINSIMTNYDYEFLPVDMTLDTLRAMMLKQSGMSLRLHNIRAGMIVRHDNLILMATDVTGEFMDTKYRTYKLPAKDEHGDYIEYEVMGREYVPQATRIDYNYMAYEFGYGAYYA